VRVGSRSSCHAPAKAAVSPACYQIVRDRDGYAWRVMGPNGEIACSAKHFKTKVAAEEDIHLFKQVVSEANAVETKDVSSDRTT
jgi:uncharacterized protein YegP (UPF0339 family)